MSEGLSTTSREVGNMMYQQNTGKLKALSLRGMISAYTLRHSDPAFEALSFDEALAVLLDAQQNEVEQRRYNRLLKEARLKQPQACIEDIDYQAQRGLVRSVMSGLNTLAWVDKNQNVVFVGSTGGGKSYLACAYGQLCIRKGYRVQYKRLSRLLEELEVARADGSLPKLRAKIARYKLLILDDWGVSPISARGREDLLEVIEDRIGSGSIIVTSQLPVEQWHDWIGEPTIADAILDRLVHSSHIIKLHGESMRKALSPIEEVPS